MCSCWPPWKGRILAKNFPVPTAFVGKTYWTVSKSHITHSVVCRHAVYTQTSKAFCIPLITIQDVCCNLWCVSLMFVTQSSDQSPRRSVRRAIEKHLHYGPWLWQSVFTMQTECELNIPDLVKLGRSERAALGTKISVSSLQCARPSMMQLSRHASDLPLLSSTSKHVARIKSRSLIGKPRTCRPGYEIVICKCTWTNFLCVEMSATFIFPHCTDIFCISVQWVGLSHGILNCSKYQKCGSNSTRASASEDVLSHKLKNYTPKSSSQSTGATASNRNDERYS